MACSKCGKENCSGFFLLHSKEMSEIPRLKARQRELDSECEFELIDSPSSGEVFTKFKELHVISEKLAKKGISEN